MAILDASGKPVVNGTPVTPKDPSQEISRVIRLVENARRVDTADLCATLEAVAAAGWGLTIDGSLPSSKVEVTLVTHLKRDVEGKILTATERWVRLGPDYTEALTILNVEKSGV